jgi:hypothetical protein
MPGLACAIAWAGLTHDEKMRGKMLTRHRPQPGLLRRLVTSMLLIPLLAACGTLEVGFEDRATPTGVVTAPVQTVESAETRLQANDHSSSPKSLLMVAMLSFLRQPTTWCPAIPTKLPTSLSTIGRQASWNQ